MASAIASSVFKNRIFYEKAEDTSPSGKRETTRRAKIIDQHGGDVTTDYKDVNFAASRRNIMLVSGHSRRRPIVLRDRGDEDLRLYAEFFDGEKVIKPRPGGPEVRHVGYLQFLLGKQYATADMSPVVVLKSLDDLPAYNAWKAAQSKLASSRRPRPLPVTAQPERHDGPIHLPTRHETPSSASSSSRPIGRPPTTTHSLRHGHTGSVSSSSRSGPAVAASTHKGEMAAGSTRGPSASQMVRPASGSKEKAPESHACISQARDSRSVHDSTSSRPKPKRARHCVESDSDDSVAKPAKKVAKSASETNVKSVGTSSRSITDARAALGHKATKGFEGEQGGPSTAGGGFKEGKESAGTGAGKDGRDPKQNKVAEEQRGGKIAKQGKVAEPGQAAKGVRGGKGSTVVEGSRGGAGGDREKAKSKGKAPESSGKGLEVSTKQPVSITDSTRGSKVEGTANSAVDTFRGPTPLAPPSSAHWDSQFVNNLRLGRYQDPYDVIEPGTPILGDDNQYMSVFLARGVDQVYHMLLAHQHAAIHQFPVEGCVIVLPVAVGQVPTDPEHIHCIRWTAQNGTGHVVSTQWVFECCQYQQYLDPKDYEIVLDE